MLWVKFLALKMHLTYYGLRLITIIVGTKNEFAIFFFIYERIKRSEINHGKLSLAYFFLSSDMIFLCPKIYFLQKIIAIIMKFSSFLHGKFLGCLLNHLFLSTTTTTITWKSIYIVTSFTFNCNVFLSECHQQVILDTHRECSSKKKFYFTSYGKLALLLSSLMWHFLDIDLH